jgi:hypothetical protein
MRTNRWDAFTPGELELLRAGLNQVGELAYRCGQSAVVEAAKPLMQEITEVIEGSRA